MIRNILFIFLLSSSLFFLNMFSSLGFLNIQIQACGGEIFCPSGTCGSVSGTVASEFKEEKCDLVCKDNTSCGGSTSGSCSTVEGPYSVSEVICFDSGWSCEANGTCTSAGCIGTQSCTTTCGPGADGCFETQVNIWCCDTPAAAEAPVVGGGEGADDGGGGGGGGALPEPSPSPTAPPETCGNGSCAGFETCVTCSTDCGLCPAAYSWWQVWGGHLSVGSDDGYTMRSTIPGDTCVEPDCYPYLSSKDRAGTEGSDGFPIAAGGTIYTDSQDISARESNVFSIGSERTRLDENYSFFYSQYSLGTSPEDDYSGSEDDALEPGVSKDAYFHSGDMTIQSPWDVTDGESYVVFVDGDLTIDDPLTEGELIKVEEGGFLSFIVSGDINIADTVGHTTLTNTAGNIEGVYIADGTITIESNGGLDKRFVSEGTLVGWTDVVMPRNYDEGAQNGLYPTETFIYRPDLVKNTPVKMKRPQMLWQETN
jgi:hypothetical protein